MNIDYVKIEYLFAAYIIFLLTLIIMMLIKFIYYIKNLCGEFKYTRNLKVSVELHLPLLPKYILHWTRFITN